ncbi:MAG: holin [Propionibacteriaceae bacterium]|jgi:hypothetical protein|nr:holin [Propionibacteriaceae bacterium]
MWTKQFWKALAERAIKTACEAAVALLTANATGLLDIDWISLLSVVAMATLVSVLTTIASGTVTGGAPSLNGAEELKPAAYKPYEPDQAGLA